MVAYSHADTGGRLAGYVTDENGRPIPSARVKVTGTGAVGVYHATTDQTGYYQVPGLPLREPLDVRAEIDGKVAVVYSGQRAGASSPARRDFRLRPAGWKEVLVVLDPRVPYHQKALEGAKATLPASVRVVALSGDASEDLANLKREIADRPNAVMAIGSDAAAMARRWIKDVPVVYTMVLDPIAEDLGNRNLCGVALNGGFGDQLSKLEKLKPDAKRLATIYDPRTLSRSLKRLRAEARARGMSLEVRPARSARQVASALRDLAGEPVDAFFLLLDPKLFDMGSFERVRRFAADRDMVFIVPDSSLVAAGGTFSFAPGFRELGAYAGRLVGQILLGNAEPSNIGMIFPTTRYFAVNTYEAARLGIDVPAVGG